MGFLRPATPGFIVTLIATIILAIVVFCVPYVKSVYFLKASITYQNVSGNITFGTLGYCVELSGNTTCSNPSIGYELDINNLVGNSLPVKIPQVVVKWLTYFLFLHVIALVAATGSAFFGLLAHVREISMTCCSTCFSGFAAVITLIAFIFDIILFFVAKSRINAIGHAQIGNAIWLTLAAWVLLFFSGCFYTLGRCCLRGRPGIGAERGSPDKNYSEQMRLDAVKAEADRKARQKQGEVGLPAFYETQPLTGHVAGDQVYLDGQHNESISEPAVSPSRQRSTNFAGGYAPGPAGSRTMDDYYHDGNTPSLTGYPPQQAVRRRQSEFSTSSGPTTSASPPITYGQFNAPVTTSPPPSNNQLFVPSGHHQPYHSNTMPDPYDYGHNAGGSSYHSAISHEQVPSSYAPPYESLVDPYTTHQPQTQRQSTYPYVPTFVSHTSMPQPLSGDASHYYPNPNSPPPIQHPQPLAGDRRYTLGGDGYGGDGYGDNQLPSLQEHVVSPPTGASPPSNLPYGRQYQYPLPAIDTNVASGYHTGQPIQTSPVRGPIPSPNEAPPSYELGGADVIVNSGKR